MRVVKNFIVFEGCDGSGTSTAMTRLQTRLAAAGTPAVFTAEPSEAETGRLIRRSLAAAPALSAQTLAYLFAADRAEHVYGAGGIVARAADSLVFCDRYVLSSLVYQGISCGPDLPMRINAEFPAPEKLFYFDIDIETAQRRLSGRASLEIFEGAAFQRAVLDGYRAHLDFCRAQGTELVVIDAREPPECVEAAIARHLGIA
ncbi:MAG: dTMP kinase [Spirochaetaceae bacterium]|jgi:dTMP kinase|nr:dTMP kinase [Spirochaetaceae bacterium]